MFFSMEYKAPIGKLTIAATDDSVVGLWIEGQKYFLNTLQEELVSVKGNSALRQAEGWLDRYFAGDRPAPEELPLSPMGGKFRQDVWKILCEIPYGEVTTYGRIAKKIAAERGIKSMSAQAVGGAVGHNPISIIIPCHRVIGADGGLTGYAGGLETKEKLLSLEGVDIRNLSDAASDL
ncbi:MAG: methylated-DNA--[protein]-cysteine S-methyltransferase [Lachnospiraceae bacterium]|nr:methylated-DNA--[protein]-cysteine S-methyltransferase [Lachnospiraceae bacterium]